MISECEEIARRAQLAHKEPIPQHADCLEYFIRKAHLLRSEALFDAPRRVWKALLRGLF